MAGGRIEGVLFDFGNTLCAHAPLAETVATAAGRIGMSMTVDEAGAVARRIDELAADTGEIEHPRDLDDGVWSARWRLFYSHADQRHPGLGEAIYRSMHEPAEWQPYAHAADVLDGLRRRGVRVGVVSNTGWDVRNALRAAGLARGIDHVTLSYEVGLVKPDPAIFLACCAALDVAPDRTLMVGDDPSSDSGAVRAGLRALLLPPAARGTDNGLLSVLDLVDGERRDPAARHADDPRA